MAEVKRSSTNPAVTRAAAPVAAAVVAGPNPLDVLTLPDAPSEISNDINDYSFLIHGAWKIGKTTMALEEPGVLLLTFDPPHKSLSILQRFITNWQQLQKYLQLLEQMALEGNYIYRRVVLDGVDMMYRHCQRYCEQVLRVRHISNEDWGRGWDMLKDQFTTAVDRYMALPGGCWFICHSEWRDVQTRRGEKTHRLVPFLKPAASEIVIGKVDGWFAYDYNGSERVLVVRGDEVTGAGCKINGHFLTPKGRQLVEVPMGHSSQEAWEAFQAAFYNEQKFITCAERDKYVSKTKGDPEPQIPF